MGIFTLFALMNIFQFPLVHKVFQVFLLLLVVSIEHFVRI